VGSGVPNHREFEPPDRVAAGDGRAPGCSGRSLTKLEHQPRETKLIREVIVDPDRVFYDPNTAPHYHIYNVETGELTDIDAQDVRIEGLPQPPPGMVTEGMDIIIRVRSGTSS